MKDRSLRPFPQYNIATGSGGDHSGHSSYHSLLLKVTRRYARGLMIDGSYVFSKMFTDSDSMWGSGAAIDQYNRRLDKALSASDRTHELKVNYVYNLPIGHGQKWLKHGFLSQAIGGWRLGAVQAFNVLNRTIFGTPNTNMSDIANFGLVRTQANVARRMQFALKLNW